jgi:hypothetical protein
MKRTPLSTYQSLVGIPRIVDSLLRLTFAGSLALFIVWSRDGIGTGAKGALVVGAAVLLLLWLNTKGYPRLAGIGLLYLDLAISTYFAIDQDGFYNIPIMIYPMVIISAGIIFGRRLIPLTTALALALLSLLYTLNLRGFIDPFHAGIQFAFGDYLIGMILLGGTSGVLWLIMDTVERNLEEIVRSREQLDETYNLTLKGWARALELRGREPLGHAQRVQDLIEVFGKHLGVDEATRQELRRGAYLHDIGKMGIPDKILLKRGPLTTTEFETVKTHTSLARKVLANIPFLQPSLPIPLYHHESWDGSGYPEGLAHDQIPLIARIFALVDNWDSLTSKQIYRPPWSKRRAVEYIRAEAGKKFDSELADKFVELMETW